MWISACNGHISRIRLRRNEKSGTIVLYFPLCQISSWNTDTCLVLSSCPGDLLESKSPYLTLSVSESLSLALLFSILQFLLNSYASILPVVIPDEIFQQGVQSKSLPIIFPTSSDPLSTKNWWSRMNSCVGIQTFQHGHPTHKFPTLSHSQWPSWQYHLYCGLHGSDIWLIDQHIFSHVHMWAMAIITLLSIDTPWTISTCGFAGEVDFWTRDWGI